jgi:hypothetical protein
MGVLVKRFFKVALVISITLAQVAIANQSAMGASKGKWYREGYAAIMEHDPDTLYKWGIAKAFGATGNPVKSKMQNFCSYFTVWEIDGLPKSKQSSARKEWNSGCLAAGMSLKLSDFYAGNN